jgi:hypothetical protein
MIEYLIICALILAMSMLNDEFYKIFLYFFKNEYFSALLCWMIRVNLVLLLIKKIIDEHYYISQTLLYVHITEGVLLLLLLTPIIKLFKVKEKK